MAALPRNQSEVIMSPGRSHALASSRRNTSKSLSLSLGSGPASAFQPLASPGQARPKTSASLRLAARNANAALQCWQLPSSEGGGGGTQANLLERAVSTISLTGVAEEGADGDFLRRVLKSGHLTGLHKACAQGNINAVVSIVKIDSERQGQLGYAGLSACDVFGRTPLMYAAVANSKPCLDMMLTCGTRRDVRDPTGHTAVHYAAHFGQHRALKFLIEAACDWSARDNYGRTPLHTCINNDNVKCLQLLLKHRTVVGGEVDLADKENMTPLHVAAHCGKAQHLSVLLKAGADPAAVDVEGKTAMHWTVTNTDSSCVTTLHQAYPAIVNMRDIFSETALHIAAKLGYAHIVDAICMLANCDMDIKCRDDQSALHLATIHCQNSCVASMLRHGALDACVDSFGLSPLHYAVQSGSVEVVRLFCRLESLASLPDSDGRRPLHWAVVEENPELLSMLLEHPDMLKHINVGDKTGMTPAHIAVDADNTDCLAELLNSHANMSQRTAELESPLFVACEMGRTKCVEMITNAGCNPNISSADGVPCIHSAILGGHSAVVKVLLQHNADPNLYDGEGVSALQAAAFHGLLTAADDLLLNGAGPNDQGASGLTPLHLAASSGHTAVVEALLRHGAAANLPDMTEKGLTAVDHALEADHTDCVDVLRQYGCMSRGEIRTLAATVIQAQVRGFLARKNIEWVVERKAAAILIQKTVRGFLRRRAFQRQLLQKHSAILLQSHWRGCMERRRYKAKRRDLCDQEHRQYVVRTVYGQMIRKWKQDGLRRTAPKALPPTLTKKQLLKHPPTPVPPPDYDLEPVKSVARLLRAETPEQHEERMAVERRQRLEMALAMRDRQIRRAETIKRFHEKEKERIKHKEEDKERERYSSIVQASMKRQQDGRARLHHSQTVRSTVSAAITVQRCFRLWREKAQQRPLQEEGKKRQVERENEAAEVIQGTWRHYRGMKKVKEAKELLRQYRADTLLRGTEADMNVARYQRPTVQKRYQARKLQTASSPIEAAQMRRRMTTLSSRQQDKLAAVPLSHHVAARAADLRIRTGGQSKRGQSVPTPSSTVPERRSPVGGFHGSLPQRPVVNRGGTSGGKFFLPKPPKRQDADITVQPTGYLTRTAIDGMTSPVLGIHQLTTWERRSVAIPPTTSSAKRWSIPSLRVLPRIDKKM